MIYSCFDSSTGMYSYFEDDRPLAINADLPVPKMPAMAGTIGVPAMDGGRPLPADARLTGQGWHAKGIIVKCRGGALSGDALSDLVSTVSMTSIAIALAGVAAGYIAIRYVRSR